MVHKYNEKNNEQEEKDFKEREKKEKKKKDWCRLELFLCGDGE